MELKVNIEEVLDSEVDDIQRVFTALGQRQKTRLHLEAFRQECIERFAEIGFVCNPKVWETNVPSVYIFELELNGRTAVKAFDRERMAHEVQNDLLGLGEGGVIGADGLWRPN